TQGFFTTRSGVFQFNNDNLQNYIPRLPNLPGNGVCQTAGRNTDPDCYPGAPASYYLVGYNPATRAVRNANSPIEDSASLIPETDRTTLYADGSFDLTDNIQIYTELLANRRTTKVNGFRQYWTFNYTASNSGLYSNTDPFSVGWSGDFILSPTPTTDWYDSETRVDYTRAVLGARGGFSVLGFKDWSWDLYGQASRSLGYYSQQVILQDAIDSQSFRTGSCVGDTLPVSGRPCIDINFTDPNVLAGNLTQAQKDFLFDTDVGKTKYNQNYLEGSIGGNWFDLPAGPLGMSLGFHYQNDKIDDVPGIITREDNSWGLTSAGITAGKQTMKEVYGELSIPLIKDRALFENVGLTLSGRYTDVDTAGSRSTYKIGLNWQVVPQFKIRFTRGTSFRAPALFELYLADQSDFADQRDVDPCINWGSNLANGVITQRLADNCANPAGPGGGVPDDASGGGASAEVHTSGGLGVLRPESSMSTVWGVVWSPKFIDLNVAVDYFDIHVQDEVTTLGSNIPSICYNSLNFPNDPVCNLFVRNSGTKLIDLIQDKYINISSQRNRGIDVSDRYGHDLPWDSKLMVDGQFTWRLQDTTQVFAGTEFDNNHRLGYPQFSGQVDATVGHGPWRFLYGAQLIGEQSSMGDYGQDTIRISGVDHLVKANAAFQAIHHASVTYNFKTAQIIVGVSNLYDKAPPQVTTVSGGLGLYNTVGTSYLGSQYSEGYLGRRGFVRVSKKF
ncbi:MAG: TonB-dependent receptor, partial [Caulobacteraceae bacterium]|nr:TonB-dependent receptor [Caulobacteraceae bacterium]